MRTRARAFVEVAAVFCVTLSLIAALGVSPIGEWQRGITHRAFLEYTLMIGLPLLFLAVARRNAADHGISVRNFRYQLDVAMTVFVPVALASVPLAYVDFKAWDGAVIMTTIEMVLLFVVGWLLKRKSASDEKGLFVGILLIGSVCAPLAKATLGNAVSAFVFYLLFLGLGEELLFRGYIQSRLNKAFGKPYQFLGIRWGGGLILTSVLFGLMHVLNIGSLSTGHWQLAWWWGLWNIPAGLVLGIVREKTGGIISSTILHGLPQAIAYAFLGL